MPDTPTGTIELLDRNDLRELLQEAQPPVVTVALPTERAVAEPEHNALRAKQQRKLAADALAGAGVGEDDREAILADLDALLADAEYWAHQLDGLVHIAWHGGSRTYRLPYRVDERADVDQRAHLQPLLPALELGGAFHVLALSQGQVRLLRCTRSAVERVDLAEAGIPASLEEAVAADDADPPHLDHRAASAGGDRQVFHGHGGSEHESKQIEKFLRAVVRGVDRTLAGTTTPLVLAAVDELAAGFRARTRLSTLAGPFVAGSPDQRRDEELRDAAWPIVEEVLRAPVHRAVEQHRAKQGTGLALSALPEVLMAASMGRVATLLVRRGAQRWGQFVPGEGVAAERDAPAEAHDEDLVALAVATTLLHGGDAFYLDPGEMPADAPLAAVCRF